ncbi:NADH:flavin oxidoreductase/NADH oxidase [Glycomyces algeriensis]|uniref:Oxidoreductase n=1 Tax=Glycomyces algeriensis TaxID=256037 RepID=A0A9W6LI60_9ACTN|nr:NADH:flavin oxidoreductase/NADH oxidase [Glycomyces algeriensis]MDA1368832.1 NADH:flavin oxidoreductase/NADH oxidase [Glycomyces algeriensis]MDR7350848.1 2,4-dienoyl-CoA reductase-like NADH-dependent reductase (Old Yellow Enzyme family) [Glycomyces algeriensis]GLI43559.1 oxidoreductase [Glycomyces algeriensis]
MTSNLFTPITLRGTTVPNRIWMAPMCQYSADATGSGTGVPNDWHVQHYGSRAAGGPGLILVEATAVVPEGRISPYDLGIWNDAQVEGHRRLTAFMRGQGVVPGIQIAHAGRKASTDSEAHGGGSLDLDHGGWETVAPSAVAFSDDHAVPHELSIAEIRGVVTAFAEAARRSLEAGYEVIEVHAAHGYLVHEFLSPVSNRREDAYGGDFERCARLPLEIADAVRATVGEQVPVLFRLSATDWIEPEGWTADQTVRLAALLREHGVDLIDVSTGGNIPNAPIASGPGYQVPFAERIRREAGIPTAAVGIITEVQQAEKILVDGGADAVLLGRELLRNPYWPRKAAHELGDPHPLPRQYRRADRKPS